MYPKDIAWTCISGITRSLNFQISSLKQPSKLLEYAVVGILQEKRSVFAISRSSDFLKLAMSCFQGAQVSDRVPPLYSCLELEERPPYDSSSTSSFCWFCPSQKRENNHARAVSKYYLVAKGYMVYYKGPCYRVWGLYWSLGSASYFLGTTPEAKTTSVDGTHIFSMFYL